MLLADVCVPDQCVTADTGGIYVLLWGESKEVRGQGLGRWQLWKGWGWGEWQECGGISRRGWIGQGEGEEESVCYKGCESREVRVQLCVWGGGGAGG